MPTPAITKAETARRVELVRQMLLARESRSDVLAEAARKFGTSKRTAQRYVKRAQAIILRDSRIPRDQLVAEAYEFYRRIAADESVSTRDRLSAQAKIDKLFGLTAPHKVALTDSAGRDVLRQQTDEAFAELVASLRRRQSLVPGSN